MVRMRLRRRVALAAGRRRRRRVNRVRGSDRRRRVARRAAVTHRAALILEARVREVARHAVAIEGLAPVAAMGARPCVFMALVARIGAVTGCAARSIHRRRRRMAVLAPEIRVVVLRRFGLVALVAVRALVAKSALAGHPFQFADAHLTPVFPLPTEGVRAGRPILADLVVTSRAVALLGGVLLVAGLAGRHVHERRLRDELRFDHRGVAGLAVLGGLGVFLVREFDLRALLAGAHPLPLAFGVEEVLGVLLGRLIGVEILVALHAGVEDGKRLELRRRVAVAIDALDALVEVQRMVEMRARFASRSAPRGESRRSAERREGQGFVGALSGKADGGVFITTSRFSPGAVEWVRTVPARIILIDGRRLAELMIEYGVGVQVQRTYRVVKIDEDFFT